MRGRSLNIQGLPNDGIVRGIGMPHMVNRKARRHVRRFEDRIERISREAKKR